MDPIEILLTDALAAEQIDRADLERIVAANPEHSSAVERVRVVFPEWRLGQAYMNVLRVARPELYLEVTSSEVDCFYADAKVPRWFAGFRSARLPIPHPRDGAPQAESCRGPRDNRVKGQQAVLRCGDCDATAKPAAHPGRQQPSWPNAISPCHSAAGRT